MRWLPFTLAGARAAALLQELLHLLLLMPLLPLLRHYHSSFPLQRLRPLPPAPRQWPKTLRWSCGLPLQSALAPVRRALLLLLLRSRRRQCSHCCHCCHCPQLRQHLKLQRPLQQELQPPPHQPPAAAARASAPAMAQKLPALLLVPCAMSWSVRRSRRGVLAAAVVAVAAAAAVVQGKLPLLPRLQLLPLPLALVARQRGRPG